MGRRDWDPPLTSCSAPCPPQLFLCCLLNLQESGLLCEVRQGLGVGGTVPESSGEGGGAGAREGTDRGGG